MQSTISRRSSSLQRRWLRPWSDFVDICAALTPDRTTLGACGLNRCETGSHRKDSGRRHDVGREAVHIRARRLTQSRRISASRRQQNISNAIPICCNWATRGQASRRGPGRTAALTWWAAARTWGQRSLAACRSAPRAGREVRRGLSPLPTSTGAATPRRMSPRADKELGKTGLRPRNHTCSSVFRGVAVVEPSSTALPAHEFQDRGRGVGWR